MKHETFKLSFNIKTVSTCKTNSVLQIILTGLNLRLYVNNDSPLPQLLSHCRRHLWLKFASTRGEVIFCLKITINVTIQHQYCVSAAVTTGEALRAQTARGHPEGHHRTGSAHTFKRRIQTAKKGRTWKLMHNLATEERETEN